MDINTSKDFYKDNDTNKDEADSKEKDNDDNSIGSFVVCVVPCSEPHMLPIHGMS